MSQLKALTKLYVGENKLPSTDVDFIIESFPQLTELGINDLGLAGERLRSTNSPLTTLPAALPDSIGQLEALETLWLKGNNLSGTCLCSTNSPLTLARTELPSTIGNLKALKMLEVQRNSLQGEHLRSTNRASDPSRTRACSAPVHDRQFEGARVPRCGRQRPERYVFL